MIKASYHKGTVLYAAYGVYEGITDIEYTVLTLGYSIDDVKSLIHNADISRYNRVEAGIVKNIFIEPTKEIL